jgi:hypothetical protein
MFAELRIDKHCFIKEMYTYIVIQYIGSFFTREFMTVKGGFLCL